MNKFEKLLQENILNPVAQAIGDDWIETSKNKGNEGYKAHDRVFGEDKDIVIPVEHGDFHREIKPYQIPDTVKQTLTRHGYGIHDYIGNVATRTRKNQMGMTQEDRPNISKILARDSDKTALTDFNNDPIRKAANSQDHEIVISRDPQKLLRMTSSRRWAGSSCMRLPGAECVHPELTSHIVHNSMELGGVFHHHIRDDIEQGTLIANLVRKGDHAVENPISRVLLKRHSISELRSGKELGKDRDVWVPEFGTDYGTPTDDFKHSITKWANNAYPISREGEKTSLVVKKNKELYDDVKNSDFVHHPPGVIKTENKKLHYNENGKLHDMPNGEPAHIVNSAHGDTIRTHYKNGILGRDDDKPAIIKQSSEGEPIERKWAKNGLVHRDGDKPSIIRKNGKDTYYEYHKYDLLHRDTKFGPALHSPYQNKYSMNGITHRPVNEGPANIDIDGDYSYNEYGVAKRPPTGGPSSGNFKHNRTAIWASTDKEPTVTLSGNKEILSKLHNDGSSERIDFSKGIHTTIRKNVVDIKRPLNEADHEELSKYVRLSKIAPTFTKFAEPDAT